MLGSPHLPQPTSVVNRPVAETMLLASLPAGFRHRSALVQTAISLFVGWLLSVFGTLLTVVHLVPTALSYHSVENVSIILVGLGVALSFFK